MCYSFITWYDEKGIHQNVCCLIISTILITFEIPPVVWGVITDYNTNRIIVVLLVIMDFHWSAPTALRQKRTQLVSQPSWCLWCSEESRGLTYRGVRGYSTSCPTTKATSARIPPDRPGHTSEQSAKQVQRPSQNLEHRKDGMAGCTDRSAAAGQHTQHTDRQHGSWSASASIVEYLKSWKFCGAWLCH